MSLLPAMTPQMRQSMGKILNSHIADWGATERQAQQTMQNQKPFAKTSWDERDAYLRPAKGMVQDIWKIDDGICLRKHPSLIEKLVAFLLGILDLLFAPLHALQRKIEELIFAIAAKLGQFGGILCIPLAIILMVIDFFRDYVVRLLKSITSPIGFIITILSLPIWLIKTLLSRLIQVFMAPLLAKLIAMIEKAQKTLVAFLAKYGWLRGILLGMLRDSGRPTTPIVIHKKAVSGIQVARKWGLFGTQQYLLVVEGDALIPGLGEFISMKLKQIVFPYYWERTVHFFLLPKKDAESFKAEIEEALRYDRSADEAFDLLQAPDLIADNATTISYCPQCNSSYDLARKFCGKCGIPLVPGTSASPVSDQSQSDESSGQTQPDSVSAGNPFILPVVVVVVLAIAGFIFAPKFLKKSKSGNGNPQIVMNNGRINKDVMLRQGAGAKTPQMGKLAANTQIAVLGSGRDTKGDVWTNVRVDSGPLQGLVGYVKPGYLSEGGVAPPPAVVPVPSAVAPSPSAQSSQSDEVRSVVVALYDAYLSVNLDGYMRHIHNSAVFKSKKYTIQGKESIRKRRVSTFASLENFGYEIKSMNIIVSGNTAEVHDELVFSYSSKKTGKRMSELVKETFRLVKEDNIWLIVENTEY